MTNVGTSASDPGSPLSPVIGGGAICKLNTKKLNSCPNSEDTSRSGKFSNNCYTRQSDKFLNCLLIFLCKADFHFHDLPQQNYISVGGRVVKKSNLRSEFEVLNFKYELITFKSIKCPKLSKKVPMYEVTKYEVVSRQESLTSF